MGPATRLACRVGVLVLALGLAWLAHGFAVRAPLGLIQDDGIYALAARALREGVGYRDLASPELPMVPLYPPGFPALLALASAGAGELTAELTRYQAVTPVLGAVALVLCYVLAEGAGGPCLALALAAWVAVQASFLTLSSFVMAELPLTVVALAALNLAGPVLRRGGWAAGLGLGALVGSACLIRSQGLALVLAWWLVLALARRWRLLGAGVAGTLLVFGPWWLYQHAHGTLDYAGLFSARLPGTPGAALLAAGSVLLALVGDVMPHTLVGTLLPFGPPGAPVLTLGLLGAGLALVGLRGRLQRPFDPELAFPAVWLLVTLALIGTYALSYAYYAAEFLQRALVPCLPVTLALVLEGLAVLTRGRWLAPVLAGCIALQAVGDGGMLQRGPRGAELKGELEQGLGFVRAHAAHGAVAIAPYGHLVTLYTGVPCFNLPEEHGAGNRAPAAPAPGTLLHVMAERHVSLLVGIPWFVEGDPQDLTVLTTNGLLHGAPGLLRPLWVGPGRRVVVFAVDPLVLYPLSQRQRAGGRAAGRV